DIRDLLSFPTRRSSDLSEQPRQQEIRNTYLLYIANTLNFAGQPKPIEDARTILALEKALAKISWSAVELRNDEVRTYLVETKNRSEEHTSELQSRENLV